MPGGNPSDPQVRAAFAAFPDQARAHLLAMRAMIIDTAAQDIKIGPLTETLKWGQPSYLTQATRSGTTLRLGMGKGGAYGLFAHCQTTVVSDFRDLFGPGYTYDGNRGVLFVVDRPPDPDAVRWFAQRALRYNLK